MATLHKFKLLATQCGVAQSPTRSPRTSPVVQLRRRKNTLRMLLSRSSSRRSFTRREPPSQPQILVTSLTEKKRSNKEMVGHKLKDLFVSSPSFEEEEEEEEGEEKGKGKSGTMTAATKLNGVAGIGVGAELRVKTSSPSPRPGWVGFRHRLLLRRAWRPILVTIPE